MAMITIRQERVADIGAREALLDNAFGAAREAKTSQRLREGRLAAEGLSFVATEDGRVIGTVRLWDIAAGPGRPALLLGPLAVEAIARKRGIGAALMTRALREARKRGHRAVLLVGDAPYYGRFGFSAEKTGPLWMPGAYEPHRLLGLEFVPGALDGARGMIAGIGRPEPKPALAALVAAVNNNARRPTRRAA
jgi:predicted N-acetyltransferase YhbS